MAYSAHAPTKLKTICTDVLRHLSLHCIQGKAFQSLNPALTCKRLVPLLRALLWGDMRDMSILMISPARTRSARNGQACPDGMTQSCRGNVSGASSR